MKHSIKALTFLFMSLLVFTSCSDDDNDPDNLPGSINEEEVITTMTIVLTDDSNDANTVTLTSKDIDGNGPVLEVLGTLTANTTYTGRITLSNETEDPAEDMTKEVKEEDEDHQLFYTAVGEGFDVTFEYTDADADNNPIGLEFKLMTTDPGTGTLTFILIHEPNKSAEGVKDGDITNAGGETDYEATFTEVEIVSVAD